VGSPMVVVMYESPSWLASHGSTDSPWVSPSIAPRNAASGSSATAGSRTVSELVPATLAYASATSSAEFVTTPTTRVRPAASTSWHDRYEYPTAFVLGWTAEQAYPRVS